MKIRKIILALIIAVCSAGISYGQLFPGGVKPGDDKPETGDREHTGMLLFGLKAANMMDKWGVELGLDISSRLDENFSLGGSLYYLMSKNILVETADPAFRPILNLFYAGINGDYTFWFGRTAGLSFGALLGFGQVNVAENPNVEVSYNSNYQWLFLAEPGINVIWKFSDGFGVSAGAGYRQVFGVSEFGLDNESLSGTVFKISICSFL